MKNLLAIGNLSSMLMMFWQNNSTEPDAVYKAGRSIGFCFIPALIIIFIIVFTVGALIKKWRNKKNDK